MQNKTAVGSFSSSSFSSPSSHLHLSPSNKDKMFSYPPPLVTPSSSSLHPSSSLLHFSSATSLSHPAGAKDSPPHSGLPTKKRGGEEEEGQSSREREEGENKKTVEKTEKKKKMSGDRTQEISLSQLPHLEVSPFDDERRERKRSQPTHFSRRLASSSSSPTAFSDVSTTHAEREKKHKRSCESSSPRNEVPLSPSSPGSRRDTTTTKKKKSSSSASFSRDRQPCGRMQTAQGGDEKKKKKDVVCSGRCPGRFPNRERDGGERRGIGSSVASSREEEKKKKKREDSFDESTQEEREQGRERDQARRRRRGECFSSSSSSSSCGSLTRKTSLSCPPRERMMSRQRCSSYSSFSPSERKTVFNHGARIGRSHLLEEEEEEKEEMKRRKEEREDPSQELLIGRRRRDTYRAKASFPDPPHLMKNETERNERTGAGFFVRKSSSIHLKSSYENDHPRTRHSSCLKEKIERSSKQGKERHPSLSHGLFPRPLSSSSFSSLKAYSEEEEGSSGRREEAASSSSLGYHASCSPRSEQDRSDSREHEKRHAFLSRKRYEESTESTDLSKRKTSKNALLPLLHHDKGLARDRTDTEQKRRRRRKGDTIGVETMRDSRNRQRPPASGCFPSFSSSSSDDDACEEEDLHEACVEGHSRERRRETEALRRDSTSSYTRSKRSDRQACLREETSSCFSTSSAVPPRPLSRRSSSSSLSNERKSLHPKKSLSPLPSPVCRPPSPASLHSFSHRGGGRGRMFLSSSSQQGEEVPFHDRQRCSFHCHSPTSPSSALSSLPVSRFSSSSSLFSQHAGTQDSQGRQGGLYPLSMSPHPSVDARQSTLFSSSSSSSRELHEDLQTRGRGEVQQRRPRGERNSFRERVDTTSRYSDRGRCTYTRRDEGNHPCVHDTNHIHREGRGIRERATVVEREREEEEDEDDEEDEEEEEEEEQMYMSHDVLTEHLRREVKCRAILDKAVLLFNQQGLDAAVSILQEHNMMRRDDPRAVARFLFDVPGLDQQKVGSLLGGASPFHLDLLRFYMSRFDIRNRSIDTALRYVFGKFIPPGEAQQLYRILYQFAELYVQQNRGQDGHALDVEQVHFLAYAILMLHTDRHNQKVKRKMSKEVWKSLARGGVNGGSSTTTSSATTTTTRGRRGTGGAEGRETTGGRTRLTSSSSSSSFTRSRAGNESEEKGGDGCITLGLDDGDLEAIYDRVVAEQFKLRISDTDRVYSRLSRYPRILQYSTSSNTSSARRGVFSSSPPLAPSLPLSCTSRNSPPHLSSSSSCSKDVLLTASMTTTTTSSSLHVTDKGMAGRSSTTSSSSFSSSLSVSLLETSKKKKRSMLNEERKLSLMTDRNFNTKRQERQDTSLAALTEEESLSSLGGGRNKEEEEEERKVISQTRGSSSSSPIEREERKDKEETNDASVKEKREGGEEEEGAHRGDRANRQMVQVVGKQEDIIHRKLRSSTSSSSSSSFVSSSVVLLSAEKAVGLKEEEKKESTSPALHASFENGRGQSDRAFLTERRRRLDHEGVTISQQRCQNESMLIGDEGESREKKEPHSASHHPERSIDSIRHIDQHDDSRPSEVDCRDSSPSLSSSMRSCKVVEGCIQEAGGGRMAIEIFQVAKEGEVFLDSMEEEKKKKKDKKLDKKNEQEELLHKEEEHEDEREREGEEEEEEGGGEVYKKHSLISNELEQLSVSDDVKKSPTLAYTADASTPSEIPSYESILSNRLFLASMTSSAEKPPQQGGGTVVISSSCSSSTGALFASSSRFPSSPSSPHSTSPRGAKEEEEQAERGGGEEEEGDASHKHDVSKRCISSYDETSHPSSPSEKEKPSNLNKDSSLDSSSLHQGEGGKNEQISHHELPFNEGKKEKKNLMNVSSFQLSSSSPPPHRLSPSSSLLSGSQCFSPSVIKREREAMSLPQSDSKLLPSKLSSPPTSSPFPLPSSSSCSVLISSPSASSSLKQDGSLQICSPPPVNQLTSDGRPLLLALEGPSSSPQDSLLACRPKGEREGEQGEMCFSPSPYSPLYNSLEEGNIFIKICRNGKFKQRFFFINAERTYLYWTDRRPCQSRRRRRRERRGRETLSSTPPRLLLLSPAAAPSSSSSFSRRTPFDPLRHEPQQGAEPEKECRSHGRMPFDPFSSSLSSGDLLLLSRGSLPLPSSSPHPQPAQEHHLSSCSSSCCSRGEEGIGRSEWTGEEGCRKEREGRGSRALRHLRSVFTSSSSPHPSSSSPGCPSARCLPLDELLDVTIGGSIYSRFSSSSSSSSCFSASAKELHLSEDMQRRFFSLHFVSRSLDLIALPQSLSSSSSSSSSTAFFSKQRQQENSHRHLPSSLRPTPFASSSLRSFSASSSSSSLALFHSSHPSRRIVTATTPTTGTTTAPATFSSSSPPPSLPLSSSSPAPPRLSPPHPSIPPTSSSLRSSSSSPSPPPSLSLWVSFFHAKIGEQEQKRQVLLDSYRRRNSFYTKEIALQRRRAREASEASKLNFWLEHVLPQWEHYWTCDAIPQKSSYSSASSSSSSFLLLPSSSPPGCIATRASPAAATAPATRASMTGGPPPPFSSTGSSSSFLLASSSALHQPKSSSLLPRACFDRKVDKRKIGIEEEEERGRSSSLMVSRWRMERYEGRGSRGDHVYKRSSSSLSSSFPFISKNFAWRGRRIEDTSGRLSTEFEEEEEEVQGGHGVHADRRLHDLGREGRRAATNKREGRGRKSQASVLVEEEERGRERNPHRTFPTSHETSSSSSPSISRIHPETSERQAPRGGYMMSPLNASSSSRYDLSSATRTSLPPIAETCEEKSGGFYHRHSRDDSVDSSSRNLHQLTLRKKTKKKKTTSFFFFSKKSISIRESKPSSTNDKKGHENGTDGKHKEEEEEEERNIEGERDVAISIQTASSLKEREDEERIESGQEDSMERKKKKGNQDNEEEEEEGGGMKLHEPPHDREKETGGGSGKKGHHRSHGSSSVEFFRVQLARFFSSFHYSHSSSSSSRDQGKDTEEEDVSFLSQSSLLGEGDAEHPYQASLPPVVYPPASEKASGEPDKATKKKKKKKKKKKNKKKKQETLDQKEGHEPPSSSSSSCRTSTTNIGYVRGDDGAKEKTPSRILPLSKEELGRHDDAANQEITPSRRSSTQQTSVCTKRRSSQGDSTTTSYSLPKNDGRERSKEREEKEKEKEEEGLDEDVKKLRHPDESRSTVPAGGLLTHQEKSSSSSFSSSSPSSSFFYQFSRFLSEHLLLRTLPKRGTRLEEPPRDAPLPAGGAEIAKRPRKISEAAIQDFSSSSSPSSSSPSPLSSPPHAKSHNSPQALHPISAVPSRSLAISPHSAREVRQGHLSPPQASASLSHGKGVVSSSSSSSPFTSPHSVNIVAGFPSSLLPRVGSSCLHPHSPPSSSSNPDKSVDEASLSSPQRLHRATSDALHTQSSMLHPHRPSDLTSSSLFLPSSLRHHRPYHVSLSMKTSASSSFSSFLRPFSSLFSPFSPSRTFSLDRGKRYETATSSTLVDLWCSGLPGELRGFLWSLAIGNEEDVSPLLLKSLSHLVFLVERRKKRKAPHCLPSSTSSPFSPHHASSHTSYPYQKRLLRKKSRHRLIGGRSGAGLLLHSSSSSLQRLYSTSSTLAGKRSLLPEKTPSGPSSPLSSRPKEEEDEDHDERRREENWKEEIDRSRCYASSSSLSRESREYEISSQTKRRSLSMVIDQQRGDREEGKIALSSSDQIRVNRKFSSSSSFSSEAPANERQRKLQDISSSSPLVYSRCGTTEEKEGHARERRKQTLETGSRDETAPPAGEVRGEAEGKKTKNKKNLTLEEVERERGVKLLDLSSPSTVVDPCTSDRDRREKHERQREGPYPPRLHHRHASSPSHHGVYVHQGGGEGSVMNSPRSSHGSMRIGRGRSRKHSFITSHRDKKQLNSHLFSLSRSSSSLHTSACLSLEAPHKSEGGQMKISPLSREKKALSSSPVPPLSASSLFYNEDPEIVPGGGGLSSLLDRHVGEGPRLLITLFNEDEEEEVVEEEEEDSEEGEKEKEEERKTRRRRRSVPKMETEGEERECHVVIEKGKKEDEIRRGEIFKWKKAEVGVSENAKGMKTPSSSLSASASMQIEKKGERHDEERKLFEGDVVRRLRHGDEVHGDAKEGRRETRQKDRNEKTSFDDKTQKEEKETEDSEARKGQEEEKEEEKGHVKSRQHGEVGRGCRGGNGDNRYEEHRDGEREEDEEVDQTHPKKFSSSERSRQGQLMKLPRRKGRREDERGGSSGASHRRKRNTAKMTIRQGVHTLLQAYERHRPDVGIVHGMTGIAAMLLCFMDLPGAFISFVNLLPSLHLLDFYSPASRAHRRAISRKFEFFELALKARIPALYRHLKGLDVHPDLYLLQWIESLFSEVLPFHTLCIAWDCILLLGEGYIFQLALGLLKYYETELLVNSFEGCLLILNRSIRPDADEEGGFFDRSRFLKCVGLCPVDRNEYAQWLAVQRIQEEKTNLLQLAKRALH